MSVWVYREHLVVNFYLKRRDGERVLLTVTPPVVKSIMPGLRLPPPCVQAAPSGKKKDHGRVSTQRLSMTNDSCRR